MKTLLFTTFPLLCAIGAFAQGQVNFNNRFLGGVPGLPQGPVIAPIYGVDPNCTTPGVCKTGQSSIGFPTGTTVYGGALLSGTGFTVQLWGGAAGTPADRLELCTSGDGPASTTFRTGAGAGFLAPLVFAAVVPHAPPGVGSRAALQVRAWDNQDGTLTSWAEVLDSLTARGASPVFTPPFDLGGIGTLPPNLIGLVSFELCPCPEPSAVALAMLGAACCWQVLRRRPAK